ncbi:hypothetical protein FOA43_004353 [Brettanomyces nanus]|uniref:Glycoside hydrolase family 5 C-terminal domain-containing protein n=1 Tax=Eeniella nana TaxID=13502 RepID=A0A875SBR4_EENNA|nr:uncharacterized protein FOA43_004353 [Brettanomyces nanus]QPG76959.1 hypothetical protein FOA43_004353 [Brettanomyces nanus]
MANLHHERPSVGKLRSLLRTERLDTDKYGNFVQPSTGRRVTLHGINFASSSKLPYAPYQTTYMRPKKCGFYSEADTVSFVNRPFPLDEAYEHLTRIKMCGYNTIRFVFTWEAIEHEGPEIYDLDYVHYVVELLKIIDEVGGLYVFLDPHQDVWSKFCGGSGAPIWTLCAAGLNPLNFEVTGACKLHNLCKEPQNFTRMVWSTNCSRLAAATMFTMFFSGKMFTPKAIIDNQNIQDYLQDHFINAVAFLVSSIKNEAPELFQSSFLGVESLNEPSKGYYGIEDLSQLPKDQPLCLDETPRAIQSMRMGMGRRQVLEVYQLTMFGPRKKGSLAVDPKGEKAWLTDDSMDKRYGFDRDENWKLGECIFAQHGVWDSHSGELLKPDYFHRDPIMGRELDEDMFINTQFLSFWAKFRSRMRKIDRDMFLIIQAPVLQIPPRLKDSDLVDDRTAIAIHYYDGMSLIFRSWNRKMNVDTLGIMRGRYLNPIFGIVFGEKNIRESMKRQLLEMKRECKENAGDSVPVIISETGMPFDMDDKKAYSDGDYSSQEAANDAMAYALDGSNLNFSYWCYNPENNHKWGDNWNLEDFSIFSKNNVFHNSIDYTVQSSADSLADGKVCKYSEWITTASSVSSSAKSPTLGPSSRKGDDTVELEVMLGSDPSLLSTIVEGIRAPMAIIRPYPVLINGVVVNSELNLSTGEYNLRIDTSKRSIVSSESPTVVFVPDIHFQEGNFQVFVTEGTTSFKYNSFVQLLEWYHETDIGVIELRIKSLSKRFEGQECSTSRKLFRLLSCGLIH